MEGTLDIGSDKAAIGRDCDGNYYILTPHKKFTLKFLRGSIEITDEEEHNRYGFEHLHHFKLVSWVSPHIMVKPKYLMTPTERKHVVSIDNFKHLVEDPIIIDYERVIKVRGLVNETIFEEIPNKERVIFHYKDGIESVGIDGQIFVNNLCQFICIDHDINHNTLNLWYRAAGVDLNAKYICVCLDPFNLEYKHSSMTRGIKIGGSGNYVIIQSNRINVFRAGEITGCVILEREPTKITNIKHNSSNSLVGMCCDSTNILIDFNFSKYEILDKHSEFILERNYVIVFHKKEFQFYPEHEFCTHQLEMASFMFEPSVPFEVYNILAFEENSLVGKFIDDRLAIVKVKKHKNSLTHSHYKMEHPDVELISYHDLCNLARYYEIKTYLTEPIYPSPEQVEELRTLIRMTVITRVCVE